MYSVVLIYHSAFNDFSIESLNWNDMDCKVLMTTVATKEEIVKITNIRPDMIFICTNDNDIDIFKFTGELIERLPNTIAGFISSVQEFDFVRDAMNIGVARYILFPLDNNEFRASVEAMKQKVSERKSIASADKNVLDSASDNDGLEEVNSFVVRNALIFIEDNYRKKISLSDVADEIYVSRWHLSKLLNKYIGKNFSEIINGYRIEEAKELLKDPSLKISTISEAVGFSDGAHFSHVFRKLTGMTANEYRNSVIKSDDM